METLFNILMLLIVLGFLFVVVGPFIIIILVLLAVLSVIVDRKKCAL